jgi:hypothetical protein
MIRKITLAAWVMIVKAPGKETALPHCEGSLSTDSKALIGLPCGLAFDIRQHFLPAAVRFHKV